MGLWQISTIVFFSEHHYSKQSCHLNVISFTGNEISLNEWEYLPPVGPRPLKGFVGLKNAGATCYMNSVLQQLFMIEPVRHSILSIEGAADDIEEELSGDEKAENEVGDPSRMEVVRVYPEFRIF